MSRVRLVLCILLLLFLPAMATGEAAMPPADFENYRLAAQNSNWVLYVREDTLGLIVKDVKTGAFMASTVDDTQGFSDNALWKGFYQSGIVLEYIEDNINKYPWANLIDTRHEKDFTWLNNGFEVVIRYLDLGISYKAVITLEDWGVCVSIPQKDIVEEMPEKYTVGSFYVYPFMGYSYMGQDEGYMFIPDGQGALIRLQDNEGRYSLPFSGTVYGANIGLQDTASTAMQFSLYGFPTINRPERVMMPVFGMVHTKKGIGYLGVIEEGDVSAAIQAYPNGVQRLKFDWITAKYTYRVVYAQQTGPNSGTINMRTDHAKTFNIRQRFLFVSGGDANYAGLAKAYRNYLNEKGTFENADSTREFYVQVDFLGGEMKNWALYKLPVNMTTTEQAREIWRELNGQGVKNILSVYKGWQGKGITGGLPTQRYDPAAGLGGQKGFADLFAEARSLDIKLCLEADVLRMNPAENPALTYSSLKKVNGTTYVDWLYGYVYESLQFLTSSKSLEIGEQLLADFTNSGVPGISLTGTTRLMTDSFHRQTYLDSSVCADYYSRWAKKAGETLPAVLDSANAYLWRYGQALVNMPMGGSDYVYTTREVPFLSIALSGRMPVYAEYVNFQANTKRFFLKLVESGARPSFYITMEDPILLQETNSNSIYSSQFSLYRDMIVSWYSELLPIHSLIAGSAIDTHVREGDLVTVTYENGLSIYLNFGEKPAAIGNVVLEPLSYKAVMDSGR